jgi:molybdopterin/thiamine biosynthesis adenylyltransferase
LTGEQEEAGSVILSRLNPDCTITRHSREDVLHAEKLLAGYDLVLSDPDPLHEACYHAQQPFLCAHIAMAQAWLFLSTGYKPEHPCLRCLPPHFFTQEKSSFLVENLAAFFLGTVLTTEAIKLLLGLHTSPHAKLFLVRFPALVFSAQTIDKNPSCLVCRRRTA